MWQCLWGDCVSDVEIEREPVRIRIQLTGIDTPEDTQSPKLKGALNKRNRYGRISTLAHHPEQGALNRAVVAAGYAALQGRYPLPPPLQHTLKSAASLPGRANDSAHLGNMTVRECLWRKSVN